jgi:hypothetical protein
MQKAQEFLKDNVLAVVAIAGMLIVVVVGGGLVLVSAKAGEIDDVKAELHEKQAQVATVEEELDSAKRLADSVVSRKEDILSSARSEAQSIVGTARSERSSAQSNLAELKGELQTTESSLVETESSLEGAEHTKELSSFGDGIWQAETDFIPGTYRTAGGNGCYWAKLNSAETFDIADNNNGVGQQVVTLDTPYFQTEGCGTWERIGG